MTEQHAAWRRCGCCWCSRCRCWSTSRSRWSTSRGCRC
jgi:hypothetical protein